MFTEVRSCTEVSRKEVSNEVCCRYTVSMLNSFAILVYRKQQYGGGGGGAAKRDRPPPSPQPGKLIVRGYPEGTNDDELRALFERFGKLEEGAYFVRYF